MAGGRRTLAYRVVWELVHGVTLQRTELVLHSCDNGQMPVGCCNPAHMRIGTPYDNNDDKARRHRTGMPQRDVERIRALLEKGMTQQEVSELFGIARTTVGAIARGEIHIYTDEETNNVRDTNTDNDT